ncbi:MAG: hypothetical protein K2L00_06330 [Muribaculaceae bacterium]|nr:hypothetical protein [Muribaculaceae bacterium]
MKKTLLFAAALATAMAANAEVFEYGFNYDSPAFPFLGLLNDETSDFYSPGNYEFVNKYGVGMPNTVAFPLIVPPEVPTSEGGKGTLKVGLGISMLDGNIYKLNPDVIVDEEFAEDIVDMPAENYEYPFLSWGEKGVTRTLFMPGWGSEDAWEDKDYNAATEDDWVPTKNGFQFTRLGTDGIVSRQDTYFQFPPMTGNVTVTVWACTTQDKNSNPNNELKALVTPVYDGVVDEEGAIEVSKEDPASKRYYKLPTATFDATGKTLAVRVGCNGALLNLMHVRIEGEKAEAAVNGIQASTVNGAAYNMLGVQVDENYKGLVIKNGKKFIQK